MRATRSSRLASEMTSRALADRRGECRAARRRAGGDARRGRTAHRDAREQAPHRPVAVAEARVPRRRPARRPVRVRRRALRGARDGQRQARRGQVRRRRRRGDGTAHGAGRAHLLPGRGHPPAEGRHQRRHAGPRGAVPRPHHPDADRRAGILGTGRRRGDGRHLPARRRVHVSRFRAGRGRPDLQPDRQGAPHVRRRDAHAHRRSHQVRDRHRLRLAAFDGPGRDVRDVARMAHRRPVDAVRLRRTDEQRAAVRGPGAGDRARRAVQRERPGAARGPRLLHSAGQGEGGPSRLGVHGPRLLGDDAARGPGGRRDGRRRRGDRPALARPRGPRLGDHRRERAQDEQRRDARAGAAHGLLRRDGHRRGAAALLRRPRPAGRAHPRRRILAQRVEGAGARRLRRPRGDPRRLRAACSPTRAGRCRSAGPRRGPA